MLVLTYGQTRIFYTMSRDGLLPAVLGRIHPRYQTPVTATLLLGGIVSIVAALVPITILGELVSIGTLFAFILVCAGILYLRRAQPTLARPFRCPGVPFVPILGILFCLYLISGLPATTMLRLIIWLGIGLVIYFGYGRYYSLLTGRTNEIAQSAARDQ
jgi:APA family basic amino acid/polyamine antiporter